MSAQTWFALAIVLVCGAIVLRSWIAYWVRMASTSKADDAGSSCHGCPSSCKKNAPVIVQLKQTKIT